MIPEVAGPIPFGAKPSFTPPPLSCDCHVHLFGPYDKFPLGDERSYTSPEAPVEMLIGLMDSLGLGRAVVVNGTAYNKDSRILIDALQRYPDRLRGIGVLDLDTTDQELDDLHAAGVRGIRINLYRRAGVIAYRGGVGMEVFHKLGPRIAERGWHVQVWINVTDLPEIKLELDKVPVDIVVDHMGRFEPAGGIREPGFALLCALLKDHGGYWTKISGADRMSTAGSPYSDTDVFAKALVESNSQRVVWGTDWPHVNHATMPLDAELLSLLDRWIADPAVLQRILVDNPAKLYDFA
jgi:2-pyrone-4,6-dicarboxylate lactonase